MKKAKMEGGMEQKSEREETETGREKRETENRETERKYTLLNPTVDEKMEGGMAQESERKETDRQRGETGERKETETAERGEKRKGDRETACSLEPNSCCASSAEAAALVSGAENTSSLSLSSRTRKT